MELLSKDAGVANEPVTTDGEPVDFLKARIPRDRLVALERRRQIELDHPTTKDDWIASGQSVRPRYVSAPSIACSHSDHERHAACAGNLDGWFRCNAHGGECAKDFRYLAVADPRSRCRSSSRCGWQAKWSNGLIVRQHLQSAVIPNLKFAGK